MEEESDEEIGVIEENGESSVRGEESNPFRRFSTVNLEGKTLQQVTQEAEKISLHSTFESWSQFSYSIYARYLLDGKTPRFIKTKSFCRVVVCRYAKGNEHCERKSSKGKELTEKLQKTSSTQIEERVVCPFRVRATKHAASGVIEITRVVLNHNCPSDIHQKRGPRSNAKFLALTSVVPKVVVNRSIPPNHLQDDFQAHYRISVSYMPMFRAREVARKISRSVTPSGPESSSLSEEQSFPVTRDMGEESIPVPTNKRYPLCGLCRKPGHNKRTCGNGGNDILRAALEEHTEF